MSSAAHKWARFLFAWMTINISCLTARLPPPHLFSGCHSLLPTFDLTDLKINHHCQKQNENERDG